MWRTGMALMILLTMRATASGDGIGWRGDGTGRYPAARPPIAWDIDSGKNILWRAAVGKGQSSPVAVGDRVLVTAEPDRLICLDRRQGKILWSRDNGYASLPSDAKASAKLPPTSPECGYATPTPVTDGKTIYALFGTGIVAAYDLDGNRRWVRYLDLPQESPFGRSASPLLADGKLLVSVGGLVALDPASGEILWQALDAQPAYGTPAVARIGETVVAITPKGDCVRTSDGRILARNLAGTECTTPLIEGGTVIFVDASIQAFRMPQAAGESIEPARIWSNDDGEGEFFASPVCHEGILYCVSNEGVLYALDLATGKVLYQHAVEIRSASGEPGTEPANLYPSLTLVGKHLLVSNDVGESLVLEPGKEYRALGQNFLDQGCAASPVPDGEFLFLRAGPMLYCIGAK